MQTNQQIPQQPKVAPNFETRIPEYLVILEQLKQSIEQDNAFYINSNPKVEKTLEKLNELINTLQS